jgi:hypothetical protein
MNYFIAVHAWGSRNPKFFIQCIFSKHQLQEAEVNIWFWYVGGEERGGGPILYHIQTTDITQYRLRFGFSLPYKTGFHLNCLTAQLSYEGRAAVEGAK